MIKRGMEYKVNPGKGSFSVNAMSGIDLYGENNQREDTKVVVLPRNENEDDITLFQQTVQHHTSTNRQQITERSLHDEDDNYPSVTEVMLEDKLLEEAQDLSLQESSRLQSIIDREKNEEEKAIIQSLQEGETSDKENDDLFQAMKLSLQEQHENDLMKMEEEENIKKLLELSLFENEQQQIQNRIYDYEDSVINHFEQTQGSSLNVKEHHNPMHSDAILEDDTQSNNSEELFLHDNSRLQSINRTENSKEEKAISIEIRNMEDYDLLQVMKLSLQEQYEKDLLKKEEEGHVQKLLELSLFENEQRIIQNRIDDAKERDLVESVKSLSFVMSEGRDE
eukprot:CAMPEP_0184866158 /NCGR_PEP_ID=MMETSP0580-20130426/21110_1 /TAXON_ID=1118495 /ORGANISM="Dactyliosolen fragilissimus" /LENGTH=336 /DNA_ID=CAMNT_0027365679 /DNA_START=148 /DNA_END=1158 /DNA_ORIENTATION=-